MKKRGIRFKLNYSLSETLGKLTEKVTQLETESIPGLERSTGETF